MKYVFKPAPNYRTKDSTLRIMNDLTIGLVAVLLFALYNASTFSGANVTHLVMLTVSAVATSFVVEIAFAKMMKQNVMKCIKSSFPWVTPLILVLICPMNTSVYAVVVCTFIGVLFGKLVFGGFGHNIFNPAAVGRAVLAASFMSSVAVDVVTGATPTATMASLGLATSTESFNTMIEAFGGLQGMLMGTYAGALGETCSILIILVGIFYAVRNVIDWRVPVVYIATIFLGASLVAVVFGMGVWYPLFHVLTGGALFGAVFMLTDPVTNPTTRVGRLVFAMGAGFLTLTIRLVANLPEGVLFSILIMNMMVPTIDRLFDGQQFYQSKKHISVLAAVALVGLVVIGVCASTLEPKEVAAEGSYNAGSSISLADDFSANNAEVLSVDGNVYHVKSFGFAGDNEFDITIVDGVVESVVFTAFNDTVGLGDLADNSAFLATFVGASDDSFTTDAVSSATMTSKAVAAAVATALESAK